MKSKARHDEANKSSAAESRPWNTDSARSLAAFTAYGEGSSGKSAWAETLRLSDVDHLTTLVQHSINAGTLWNGREELFPEPGNERVLEIHQPKLLGRRSLEEIQLLLFHRNDKQHLG